MAPLRGVHRQSATLAGLTVLLAASGCQPTVIIGVRVCDAQPDGGEDADASVPVDVPWSTGFEDGFCDYGLPAGFCFATGNSSFYLVTSPVHSGRYAAAFKVDVDAADAGTQARCVRQGMFPTKSYYGAWYFIPETAQNSGNWNLLHFQGGTPGQTLLGFWDVSLVNQGDGGLGLYLYDFFNMVTYPTDPPPSVPTNRWFHLEVYFNRAKDKTGELAVWQDSMMLLDVSGIETDNSDWGQWYVGNLATALQPAISTVYVDDVTIRSEP